MQFFHDSLPMQLHYIQEQKKVLLEEDKFSFFIEFESIKNWEYFMPSFNLDNIVVGYRRFLTDKKRERMKNKVTEGSKAYKKLFTNNSVKMKKSQSDKNSNKNS